MTKTALEAVGELLTDIVGPAFEEAAKDEWATEFVAGLKAEGFVIVPKVEVHQAMISARSVLHTLSHDKPEDLRRPERARVIATRIEALTGVINRIGGHA